MSNSSADPLIRTIYAAFNARNVDAVLAALHPEVDWPNAAENTRLIGHPAVRAYWENQFAHIEPNVEPKRITSAPDGRVVVDVHQVIRDKSGAVLADSMVQHVYTFRDGLITHMEIRQPE